MQNTWQAQYFGGFEGCDGRRRFPQQNPTFLLKLVLAACRGSRNRIIRGQRNTFETSRQPAGLRPRGLLLEMLPP